VNTHHGDLTDDFIMYQRFLIKYGIGFSGAGNGKKLKLLLELQGKVLGK
jgi:hypothetical protein